MKKKREYITITTETDIYIDDYLDDFYDRRETAL